MADEGYVKIWRKSFQNTLWKQKPFDEWHAWQYLIMKAAWKDHYVKYAGCPVELLRGQSVTTHRKLGKDWGWCHKTAARFLEKLREGLMITTDMVSSKTPHQTPHPTRKTPHQMPHPFFVVTILNYEGYQGVPNQTPHPTGPPPPPKPPPKPPPTEEGSYRRRRNTRVYAYRTTAREVYSSGRHDARCRAAGTPALRGNGDCS